MRRILISFIRLYQLMISPMMASHCRYHPSCSSYAIQAITVHGVFKGSWMTMTRLLRCHPFHPGGYDPVPEKSTDHNRHIAH